MKAKLILLRHGQSEYNKAHLFTGWTDVELSDQGREEAQKAGAFLAKQGLYPDICFTSWLKRAIHTAQIALREMEWEQIDCLKSWKLNERHYGAWQRQNKDRIKEEVGEAHFIAVRRGYDTPPPPQKENDPYAVYLDPKYRHIDPALLPRSESLKDTRARAWAYYTEVILPELSKGKNVLVSAHGNSLRALVMGIEKLTPEEIVKLEIPTGEPLIYSMDGDGILTKEY
jgi:2,3-bisphosphoglycerate-dependent phosphoglycerate mutase